MRISQETVREVKEYRDIVGVISTYLPLKKKGRNYLGLCPFHSEKTPSFTVSPEKHIYHCFGCHESGDLISFVMSIDNLTFVEAIVAIAEKVGITVEEDTSSTYVPHPDAKNRDVLKDMLFKLRDKFSSFLAASEAESYLLSRGLSAESISTFSLGYCPDSFNIPAFFSELQFDQSLFLKTGVLFKSDAGVVASRFKNRVMFPVLDYQGRTVGFGGRTLDQNASSAKYVNSEENILFTKRKLLYGLYHAKSAIKEKGFALLVEGYMDVIVLHQHGFKYSVASMGTALTDDQVQKLKRFTNKVVLAMDMDEAGQKAMEKSYDVLSRYDMVTYVLKLDAKDPADYISENGVDSFSLCLDNAVPFVEFKFERVSKQFDLSKVENVSKVLDAVCPLLQKEKDLVVRRHYVSLFASKLSIHEDLVLMKLDKNRHNGGKRLYHFDKNKKDKYQKAEDYVIFAVASDKELRQKIQLELSSGDFISDLSRQLYEVIIGSELVDKALVDEVTDEKYQSELRKLLIEMENSGHGKPSETLLMDCVQTIGRYKKEKRVAQIKTALKEETDNDRVTALLNELQELKFS